MRRNDLANLHPKPWGGTHWLGKDGGDRVVVHRHKDGVVTYSVLEPVSLEPPELGDGFTALHHVSCAEFLATFNEVTPIRIMIPDQDGELDVVEHTVVGKHHRITTRDGKTIEFDLEE